MRRMVTLALVVAIAVGGVLGGLAAFGVFGLGSNGSSNPQEAPNSGMPAPQQTMMALATEEQVTADAAPTATPTLTRQQMKDMIREQVLAHATVPVSCPGPFSTPFVRLRNPIYQPDPDFKQGTETSTAFAVGSNGIGYSLVAGSPSYQPERWVILARPVHPDPCATILGLAPEIDTASYVVGPGPVVLMKIEGDTILFETGDAETERLNFVTGKFE